MPEIITPATARPARDWDREAVRYVENGQFYPVGPVRVRTDAGEEPVFYLHGLRKAYPTPEAAIEAGNAHALKTLATMQAENALLDQWGPTVRRMAPTNRRSGLGSTWTLAEHHRPVVGEHVRLWAHGGFRTGIVVATTKGRGVTVAYATPASPQHVHLTKTTKYAVSTGVRPLSLGI